MTFDKVHPGVRGLLETSVCHCTGVTVRMNNRFLMVTLQISRCKLQLGSTSWEETMALQRVSSIFKWVGITTAGCGPHATSLSDCLWHVFLTKQPGRCMAGWDQF